MGQSVNVVNYQHHRSRHLNEQTNGHMTAGLVVDVDEDNLTDSDIDSLGTGKSVLLPDYRLPVTQMEPKVNNDDSLMQWLLQQFQQNDLEAAQQSPDGELEFEEISRNASTPIPNGDILSTTGSPELNERAKGNEIADRCAKNYSRLGRIRTANGLHYPRMPRSREASLRRKTKNPVDSVNQLLEEINRKAECLKCENDRIKLELEKATSIIGVLKQAHNQKTYHPERWATSTAALSMQSRYETGWGKQNPIVRVKRLNNTKMNSTHCLLTRSAYPDTNVDSLDRAVNRLSEVRTPTVNRLRSEHRFVVDDRLPQSPLPSWNETVPRNEVRLREKSIKALHPMDRRYSTTQQSEPIEPRENFRESSLGPLTSHSHGSNNDNGTNGATGAASKFSWIGRALSQLSLSDWTTRPRGDSKPETKRVEGAVPEIYGRLSPPISGTKNFSAMIRRPFRRKATTPGPGPTVYSPNASFDVATPANRCLSLMHLNGSSDISCDESDRDRGRIRKPAQLDEERKNSISFVRKVSHDQSLERMNRQLKDRSSSGSKHNGLPKLWRKRETDGNPGVYSFDTGWQC